jgi:hypothetical protein
MVIDFSCLREWWSQRIVCLTVQRLFCVWSCSLRNPPLKCDMAAADRPMCTFRVGIVGTFFLLEFKVPSQFPDGTARKIKQVGWKLYDEPPPSQAIVGLANKHELIRIASMSHYHH